MNAQPSQPAAAQTAGPPPAQATGRRASGACMAPECLIQEAAVSLWTLFDDAFGRANTRWVQAGAPSRTREVLTPYGRRYQRPGARGEQRTIAVSLTLSVVQGRVRGGAFISTSRPYLSLFTAPVARRGEVHWRVGRAGRVLSGDLVEDLFLSVLDDEAGATRRLARLVAYGLG